MQNLLRPMPYSCAKEFHYEFLTIHECHPRVYNSIGGMFIMEYFPILPRKSLHIAIGPHRKLEKTTTVYYACTIAWTTILTMSKCRINGHEHRLSIFTAGADYMQYQYAPFNRKK